MGREAMSEVLLSSFEAVINAAALEELMGLPVAARDQSQKYLAYGTGALGDSYHLDVWNPAYA